MSNDGGSDAGGDPTTFEMGWRNADGSVGRTVLYTTTICSNLWAPSVAVDVQGRIHIAHFQGGELKVQYLQFGALIGAGPPGRDVDSRVNIPYQFADRLFGLRAACSRSRS